MATPRRGGSERLERASALALRLLVLTLALALVVFVLMRLRLVVVPVILALVLATVLAHPWRAFVAWVSARQRLPDWSWRRGSLSLAGVVAVIVPKVATELGAVGEPAREGLEQVEVWLAEQIALWPDDRRLSDEIGRWVERNGETISAGIASGAVMVLEVVAGLLLALIVLFFFLKDGERLCARALEMVPPEHRVHVSAMAKRAWQALGGYVRGAAINGLIEAVLVGMALAVLGVPLVLPLAAITFFAGFLPVVGAVVAGSIASLVALVAGGMADALLVAAIFTAVQQLQNNVLEPLILGRSVRLHPLAIVLSLATGAVLGGVLGTLLAVPLVAVVTAILAEARRAGLIGMPRANEGVGSGS